MNEILTAVLARLATITVANGYLTNIGNQVTYWDVWDAEYAGPPSVTIRDTEDSSEKVNLFHKILMSLDVEAIAYTTEETKLVDGCNLTSDLVKCLVRDLSWHVAGMIAVRRKRVTKAIQGSGKQAIRVTVGIEIEYKEPF